jgi:hypothetical protein
VLIIEQKAHDFLCKVRIKLILKGFDDKGVFEVLTAVATKSTTFWDVAPCSLIEVWKEHNTLLPHSGPKSKPTTQRAATWRTSADLQGITSHKTVPFKNEFVPPINQPSGVV